MPDKLDFKKEYKDLYFPKAEPMLITVPPIPFLMVNGTGDPQGESYQSAMQILYSLTFTVKMSKMSGKTPAGYVDYVLPPLEGLWDCSAKGFDPDRSKWVWTSMIRLPGFVTQEVLAWAVREVSAKKPELDFSRARLQVYDEGLCVQIMHTGPYSTEQESIDKIARFIENNHLQDACGTERSHHEIYMSDPRKCAPERLKTVLRHPVIRK